MAGYVLDTSAVMTVLQLEEGAETVRDIIYSTEPVWIPFIALMEVEYMLLRSKGPQATDSALALVEEWPVATHESSYRWRKEAARIKAAGSLSLADAWIAAHALLQDAQLVHKDPEFEKVSDLRMIVLPYKERGARS